MKRLAWISGAGLASWFACYGVLLLAAAIGTGGRASLWRLAEHPALWPLPLVCAYGLAIALIWRWSAGKW